MLSRLALLLGAMVTLKRTHTVLDVLFWTELVNGFAEPLFENQKMNLTCEQS